MRSCPTLMRIVRAAGPGTLLLLSALSGKGRIDFDGDGVSFLWEQQYPGLVADSGDDDGDGTSNHAEGIAGTDPHDRSSRFQFEISFPGENEITFRWQSKSGKEYRIERWMSEGAEWEAVARVAPSLVDEIRSWTTAGMGPGIFRMVVSDVDVDGDGLTAWEEIRLGMSDGDPTSRSERDEGDFLAALRLLENPEGFTTTEGVTLGSMRPNGKEAARFLMRASFGPTDESIARVKSLGYHGWIDEQVSLTPTKLRTAMLQNGLTWRASLATIGWWRMANLAPDQLRQRMAYALSQILVVNCEPGTVIGDNPITQANYYDIFTLEGLGPYRKVLEKVTYSPVMGFYLSHLKNRKSDDPVNPTRFPDENFAREIMQLFSIGLWELHPDGTRKTDAQGRLIPTYDNETITEMAKVFTGMSHTRVQDGQIATSFYDLPRGTDYWYPMKVWDEEHEPGPKSIINGVELDGTQSGEEEVQATLDALMTHESMAPFLSRLLIQRFTSSNPSPAYLSRVSRVWNAARDKRDHLGRVLRAILLDPEALNRKPDDPFYGKVREPMVRFVALARALRMGTVQSMFNASPDTFRTEFGQYPMMARSVFNFYSPDFAPDEFFRREERVSPELQLASLSQLLQSDSRFSLTIDQARYSTASMDYSNELLLAEDPSALLDRVDLLLTGGRLEPTTRSHIMTAIQSELHPTVRVKTAIYLVSQSMECIVLD